MVAFPYAVPINVSWPCHYVQGGGGGGLRHPHPQLIESFR